MCRFERRKDTSDLVRLRKLNASCKSEIKMSFDVKLTGKYRKTRTTSQEGDAPIQKK